MTHLVHSLNDLCWDGKMSQWAKALATKTHNLSPILGVHMVMERTKSQGVSSGLYICAIVRVLVHTHTHTHTHTM